MSKGTLSKWLENPAPIGRIGQPSELENIPFLSSLNGIHELICLSSSRRDLRNYPLAIVAVSRLWADPCFLVSQLRLPGLR